ncbi:carboxypeptidase-like regulatory domain-containing protein [Emticicia fluvialis]|uniref:carboxypeptidase-like regulatory domain-containing protein n=1 Tax=Emticicia fluvialis TaxID=2974474 RepID=UPI002165B54D|nr:carboxypeptidase-like regulatory domain-containing protein [Emticicia fluvialis]
MKQRFTLLCILLQLTCLTLTLAQENTRTLKGKVLEMDKTPIEFVNVYVNNTSIGTTTKADGSFVLKIPKSIQKIEVVVSFIGYNTLKKVLQPNELVRGVIFLLEGSTVLNEVKVTAKRDRDWKKKWKIFKDGVLGDSQFTNDCEIQNQEAVRLEYDKDKNVIATASEPIFIVNKGLGYKIMFQMETFISNGKLTYFAGDKFFEHLKPKDDKQANRWKKLRSRAYNNSLRNFLVSLAKNKLSVNGFEVFQENKIREGLYSRTSVANELKEGNLYKTTADSLCSYDSLSRRYILHSKKPLLVFLLDNFNTVPVFRDYPYKYSQISLPLDSIEFTANGWITKPNSMVVTDHWGNEGFSNLLPDDYEDEVVVPQDASPDLLANLFAENDRKFWFVSGKVTAPGGLAVANADVFMNHTSTGTKTNAEGKFTLRVPATIQVLELLVTSPGFLLAKESFNAGDHTRLLNINLKPDNFSVANEKNRDFQRNWKTFEKALLGDPGMDMAPTLFTENCEILNPEVVNFAQEEPKKLTARATRPLIIQNNALGYKITYQLTRFENNGKENQITGDKYFEKLAPKDDKQRVSWEKNQLKVYQESLKYFFVSLSQNKLKENGFAVFKMLKIQDIYDTYVTVKSEVADSSLVSCTANELCKFDATANRFYLHSDYPLLVFLTHRNEPLRLTFIDYPYKRSQIILQNFYLEFTADGTITNDNNTEIRDFWAYRGLSGSLPDDFSPDLPNVNRIDFDAADIISTKPAPNVQTVNPEIVNKLAGNGILFKKTTIEEEKATGYGSLANDFNVKILEQDMSLTIFDLLKRIPGMIVKYDPNTATYTAAFSSAMSFKSAFQPAALLLDGNLVDNPERINTLLNSINVRDIQSLGAMKYSSASIFGARGGNGVIVITTKK